MTGDEKLGASTLPGGSTEATPAVKSDVDGAARLQQLGALGEELGASRVTEEARALAVRLSDDRFYVACLGQFKRGKSTLINALVGEPLLPVGFLPVTAVPTVIRYGPQKWARVKGQDGSWRDIPVAVRFRRT